MRSKKRIIQKPLWKRLLIFITIAVLLALNLVFVFVPDPIPSPTQESVSKPIVESGKTMLKAPDPTPTPTAPPISLEQEKIIRRKLMTIKETTTIASRGALERQARAMHFDMSLLTPSGLTAYDLDKRLNGTALEGLSVYYIQAELETGVNALFLASLSAHECLWGKSKIARTKNNLFGWRANTNDPGKAKIFDSKGQCILEVARQIKANYLTEGGKYFEGYTLSSMNKIYAADQEWDSKIYKTMKSIMKRVRSN